MHNRLESMYYSSAHIYLFLEYIPQTLSQWLALKLSSNTDVAAQALVFIDNKLKETNEFMQTQGLVHFDAHFWNILADDDTIYFSDFGLSLYKKFELSHDEIALFHKYKSYDRCSTVTNFLHCIIGYIFKQDPWELSLRDYIDGKLGKLYLTINNTIKRYANIALVMDDFYKNMQKVSKSTPYPYQHLESLLDVCIPTIIDHRFRFHIVTHKLKNADIYCLFVENYTIATTLATLL
jgi:hypothetical protein